MSERIKQSRVKYLRAGLREAMVAGDREAVKRLTKKTAGLLDAPITQARAH